jgi:PAS domain S-box-containing protein
MDAYFLALEERLLPAGQQDQVTIINTLTEAEKSWIESNPVVEVQNDADWPPFNFTENGKPKGYSIDYMNLLAKKSGLEVKYKTGPAWDEFMGMMRSGNLDVLLNIVQTPEREKYLLFTSSYASNPNVILSRRDTPYDSLGQLMGKKVAVPKGFYLEEILEREYPEIIIHTEKNVLDSMNAVATGKADAVVGEVAIFNYLMSEHTMFGLSVSPPVKIADYDTSRLAIAIHKTQPHLHSILQKAMAAVTAKEKAQLLDRWIGKLEDDNSVPALTIEERQWLSLQEEFSLGVDPHWAPFEFLDDKGVYSGIGASYSNLLSTRLGITLTPEVGLSWAAVLEKVQAGEIDILPTVARTPEREKYLNFSKPYISFPMVITTRKDAPFVDSLAGLDGKKVGVVQGYVSQELIEKNQKGIHVVPVQTLSEGLRQLNDGKIDAFIDNLLTITHEISRSGLNDLKIASPTKYKFELSMGVRKGLPELIPIINKALETISEQERAAIVNSWTAIQISYGVDTRTILLWGVPLAVGAILILLIIVFWIRFIQKQKQIIQQSEAEIAREKEALDAVINTVDYGILFMDTDLKARILNRAYREMWNIGDEIAESEPTVADLIRYNQGKGYYDVADEDFDEFVQSRVETIQNGNVAPVEIKQPNGRILRHQCLALPDGRRMLTYLDITERKEAEDRIRESEARTNSILQSSPMGVAIVANITGQRLYCNPRFDEMITGDRNTPTVGMDVGKSFVDVETLAQVRDKIAANGFYYTAEMERIRTDGTRFWCLHNWRPLPHWGEDAYVCWHYDISERKKAEEELSQQASVIEATLQNINQGIIMVGPGGNTVAYNEYFEGLFAAPGLSVGNFPNFQDFTKFYLEFLGANQEMITNSLQLLQDNVAGKWDIPLPDGRTIEISHTVLDKGGYVRTYNNITERKRVEKELHEAREAAEEATRAKASFLAAMSHEIRTPMGGVIGMIDLLQQTKLDDDQQHMTSTVRNSANSLLTIINDILDFSKIDAGKLDLEEVPISVRDAVEGVGEALAVNARNKNIGLSVFVDPDIPDAVLGDQVRVRQILFNLGGNAVKFTEKGKVLIRADRLLSDDSDRATIRFSIIDDGIGIPEEAQANLFTAFSQVEASTTRRFGGTGLGLSICQRLTELMAGEIGVDSKPGFGSTFHATLSFSITDEPSIKSDGLDLDGLKVMLAIDDDDMRDLIPRYLERWGAEVMAISDPDKLEETALASPADVTGLISRQPLAAQIATVERLNNLPGLASKRFFIACAGRDRTGRKAIENTMYIDMDPLIREKLIRTVAAAAGRISADIVYEEDDAPARKAKAPTVAEAEAIGQLVLFAEDNLTNQDVIGRQLNLLGYAYEVANNGKEALEMLQAKSYAILLTDCHMPVMDGFELAKSVRELDKDKGSRFPIVAITASVMKEEIDACFTAGMDDYLHKPLEMPKLSDMLRKRMPDPVGDVAVEPETLEPLVPPEPSEPTARSADTAVDSGPVDPQALKSVFGDDEETFREILGDFVGPAQANVAEIVAAAGNSSSKEVGAGAHKLKSSSRSVGATALAEACQALETAGHEDDWETINNLVPKLPALFADVKAYIDSL